MRRFLFILVAICVASLSFVHPEPANGSVSLSLYYAQKAFPNGRCEGKATVHPVDSIDQKYKAAYGGESGKKYAGYYNPQTPCVLYVDAQVKSWWRLCDIIIHEYGHSALSESMDDHLFEGAEGIMKYDDLHHSLCDNMPQGRVDFNQAPKKSPSESLAIKLTMNRYPKHLRKWSKKRIKCVLMGPESLGAVRKCTIPTYYSNSLKMVLYQRETYGAFWSHRQGKYVSVLWAD